MTCLKTQTWSKRDGLGKHVRRGGVLPAMMTSLAFPDRRVFRVLLYPKVTAEMVMSVDEAFGLGDPQPRTARSNEPFPLFMTSAKRELIDSAVFFDFFVAGAILFSFLR